MAIHKLVEKLPSMTREEWIEELCYAFPRHAEHIREACANYPNDTPLVQLNYVETEGSDGYKHYVPLRPLLVWR